MNRRGSCVPGKIPRLCAASRFVTLTEWQNGRKNMRREAQNPWQGKTWWYLVFVTQIWLLQQLWSAKEWGGSARLNPYSRHLLSRLFYVQYFQARSITKSMVLLFQGKNDQSGWSGEGAPYNNWCTYEIFSRQPTQGVGYCRFGSECSGRVVSGVAIELFVGIKRGDPQTFAKPCLTIHKWDPHMLQTSCISPLVAMLDVGSPSAQYFIMLFPCGFHYIGWRSTNRGCSCINGAIARVTR